MTIAAELSDKDVLTDKELKLAIKGTELALAWIIGKGPRYSLARMAIYRDLEQLESYLFFRKLEKQ